MDQKKNETRNGSRILLSLRPAVKALAELHRSGKVYGNISPETLTGQRHVCFCFPLPESCRVNFEAKESLSFDVSAFSHSDGTQAQRSAGYIPPEQLLKTEIVLPQSDVYSLCAVIYRMLTGEEPADFQKRMWVGPLEAPSEQGVIWSVWQEKALMKGLAVLGTERYADGAELYEALYGTKKKTQAKGQLRKGWRLREESRAAGIRRVTFLDFVSRTAEDPWDLSEEQDGSVMAWTDSPEEGCDLYIGGEGGVAAGTDCSGMFAGCKNLMGIYFNQNFYTGSTREMQSMFENCGSLRDLDLSGFDTSGAVNMGSMFRRCRSLKELDVSSFDTSRVKNMENMFSGCVSLENLELGNFQIAQVKRDQHMLDGTGWRKADAAGPYLRIARDWLTSAPEFL